MSSEEVLEKVKGIIVEQLGVAESAVTMEASFIDDLGADSLDAVELSLAVEEKTGTTIDEEAMAEIKTVADIVNYLEEHK